jgi:hypothetical protein
MVENGANGVVVHALEWYSKSGSENRPAVRPAPNGMFDILMDQGPRNKFK